MTGDVLLGIDIGTQSSKAILTTLDGEPVDTAVQPHAVSLPRPGWVEQDAEQVWWHDVVTLCQRLVPGMADRIAAVSVSGIGPCVLAADACGRPLRPAILYGVDTRAEHEIEELTVRYGRETILQRGGSSLTSQAVGPKLAWLARHEPDLWGRTRKWFMASSFAVFRLTGEYVLDHHSASQSDPLYDIDARSFVDEWAEDIAPGVEMPRLALPTEAVGAVSAKAAAETGLRPGTPVAAGTIDALAEALSVGVRRRGDLMIMYGSTIFMIQVVDAPARHPNIWSTTGVEADSNCLAAGMGTGGTATEWLRRIVGSPSYEQLFAQAREVPAGSSGLVVLPYLAGERTPFNDARARGVICGLNLTHGPGHLFRAVLESTGYGIRHNVEALAAVGGTAKRVVAVGGGTRDPLWMQIVSDILRQPQEVPERTIGACYGDALLAGIAAGLVAPNTDWSRRARTIEPQDKHQAQYAGLYGLYRELYVATKPTAHALAEYQLASQDGQSPTIGS